MRFFSRPRFLIGSLCVLQAADLLLTWLLLGGYRADVTEANPLANWILTRAGWTGLVALKFGCSLVVVAAAQALSRCRPALAGRLLGGLCLGMAVVAGYSLTLLFGPARQGEREVTAQQHVSGQLDGHLHTLQAFRKWRDQVCRDLLAGKVDFQEAVARLGHGLPNLPPTRSLASLPSSDPTSLATYLIFHTSLLGGRDRTHQTRVASLRQECASVYPDANLADPRFDAVGQLPPWSHFAAHESGETLH